MITLDLIRQASKTIAPFIKRTPLIQSDTLSQLLGTDVYVKYELFQKTGSFKVRGAFNKILNLPAEKKKNGIVAISGGNHAQAVAYASTKLGIDTMVLMPSNTPSNYIEATKKYGASIDLQPSIADAFKAIDKYIANGRTLVHPFDDEEIMCGQGTVGLEIMEDLPGTTDVFISIGGGGFEGGVSTAIKSIRPATKIFGVETEGADAMTRAFSAGKPVEMKISSIAKTLGAPSVSEQTLAIAKKNLEEIIVVSDQQALESLEFILERLKVLTEPAASCTLAAAQLKKKNFTGKEKVVLIFCGGNISLSDLCHYRFGVPA
jgi:threonine dehydratase